MFLHQFYLDHSLEGKQSLKLKFTLFKWTKKSGTIFKS